MDPSRIQSQALASTSSLPGLSYMSAPSSTHLPRFQTQAMPNLMPSLESFSRGSNMACRLGPSTTSVLPGTSLFQMDYMRELYTARERVKQLEFENVKLTAERDTLRDVLNKKQSVIRDPVPSVPTRTTHPNIRFWTVEDFEKWFLTPEAQVVNRGKEPFLEEENGDPVSDRRVGDIKAHMRSAFCELVNMKRAPPVWGELDTTGRQMFHSYMEKSYPLFRFAENGWKLDRLARTTYPAWRWCHLDENMNWKSREEKKNSQFKRQNTGEESLRLSKLRRCLGSSIKEEPDIKYGPSSVLSAQETSKALLNIPFNSPERVPAELGAAMPTDGNTCNLTSVSSGTENTPAETSSQIFATSSQPRKISKMRPSPTRNGRNLCAHRWLKAFRKTTNGTTAEFKQYYRSLSSEQRESYDREAADLVARNAWNKQAYDGTMY